MVGLVDLEETDFSSGGNARKPSSVRSHVPGTSGLIWTLPGLISLILFSGLVAFPVFAITPELPRVFLDTTYSPPTGNTITVNAGGNLQTAINNAQPGDTIVLQAGATFTGTFTLPNKGTSTQWIYIRSSAYSSLPAPGNRVSPANVSSMATIVGTGSPVVAIQTATGAHHYRFIGIEFKPGPGSVLHGLIRLGKPARPA